MSSKKTKNKNGCEQLKARDLKTAPIKSKNEKQKSTALHFTAISLQFKLFSHNLGQIMINLGEMKLSNIELEV